MDIPPKPKPNHDPKRNNDDDFLALSLSSIKYDDHFNVRPMLSMPIPPPIHLRHPMPFTQTLPSPLLPFGIPFTHPNPVHMFVPPPPPCTIPPVAVPAPVAAPSPSSTGASTSSPRSSSSSSSGRTRRKSSSPEPAQLGKMKIIPPPFPWATDRKAKIHTYEYLKKNKIFTITGTVQCKRCDKKYEMEFNLLEKFREVWRFIQDRKGTMHCRAPEEWCEPVLPRCTECGQEDSAKPIIEVRKKCSINWLFLWLGQLLGLCTLEQLKHFCKHTMHHRTAAKDRVLYLTYIQIGKQLTAGQSDGTF